MTPTHIRVIEALGFGNPSSGQNNAAIALGRSVMNDVSWENRKLVFSPWKWKVELYPRYDHRVALVAEWDRLLFQAELTLNLLRSSRVNPKLSAYA